MVKAIVMEGGIGMETGRCMYLAKEDTSAIEWGWTDPAPAPARTPTPQASPSEAGTPIPPLHRVLEA